MTIVFNELTLDNEMKSQLQQNINHILNQIQQTSDLIIMISLPNKEWNMVTDRQKSRLPNSNSKVNSCKNNII